MKDVGTLIPSLLQGGAGITQGISEGVAQLVNWIRSDDIAEGVRKASGEAADNYSGVAQSLLDKSEGRIGGMRDEGHNTYKTAKAEVKKGADEARGYFGNLVSDTETRGAGVRDRQAADLNELRRSLGMTIDKADQNVQTVDAKGMESLQRLRAEGQTFLTDISDRAESAVSEIRTNMTERAGSQVGGLRTDSEKAIRDFEARARQEGKLSDSEIASESRRIREQGRTQVAQVWNETFTKVSEQQTATRVAGNQMMTNAYSTLHTNMTGAEANILNQVTAALRTSVEARSSADQTFQAAIAAKAEVDASIFSIITGTAEHASDMLAEIALQEASAQSDLTQKHLTYQTQITDALVAVDQTRLAAHQYSIDTRLSGELDAADIQNGFVLMAPGWSNLMAPATSLAQRAMEGPQEQKGSFNMSILGCGGGTGCIDINSTLETPGGFITLNDIKIGMFILGADAKYHKVITLDSGVVPPEHRPPHLLIQGVLYPFAGTEAIPFGIVMTEDHLTALGQARDLTVGITLPSPYGHATVTALSRVPYRVGGDIELEGCSGYVCNGVAIESVIGQYPEKVKVGLRTLMQERGKVLKEDEAPTSPEVLN